MAILFGATVFIAIAGALCVPYFYAFCTQESNATVQESDSTRKEEELETTESELVNSIRVKEKGTLELNETNIKDATVNAIDTIETMASDKTSYQKLPSTKKSSQKKSDTKENELVRSLRVKEKGTSELNETNMKDATVNTIETMASDKTSYKKLPSIQESSQEELNDVFHITCSDMQRISYSSNNSSTSQDARTRAPIQVQAQFHAPNPPIFESNSKTSIKEASEKRNLDPDVFENVNDSHLIQKKKFFKKDKPSERLKKFWTRMKSRSFSKSSSSRDSSKTIYPLSPINSVSSSNQGSKSNTGRSFDNSSSPTLGFQNQPPVGHSTLLDSKPKLALMLHEVKGLSSIHIELSRESETFADISFGNVSLNISTIESRTEVQQTVASSDQDTDINEPFSLNREYSSVPGRLRR